MSIPRATARLQLHDGFGFDAAASTVDYFSRLGISHLYASPILAAQPGSTHGYDGIDAGCVSPALGGEAGLRRLVARLHEAGMGLIIDIVPNHMGIAGANNPWWQHVLEWGQASGYASWFDIDWQRPDPALQGKVLLPFLGEQYGKVLAAGELQLRFDPEEGRIFAGYYTNRFPIAPGTYPDILRQAGAPILAPAIDAFCADIGLPPADVTPGFTMLRELARLPEGIAAIDAALRAYDAASPAGAAALHALLEAQHYRLAWWRYGADGLNWRRFFEVTDLAGMRVEDEAVFEATHALVLRFYEEGLIDGVRVDHVDGLADPAGYCQQLRQCLAERAPLRPQGDDGPAYVVVEKILAAGEMLRADWQVDGTTGYDFMDQVGAFLHAPHGATELDLAWAEARPGAVLFEEEVQAARRQLLSFNLAAEFDAACHALLDLARCDLATRDYSLNAIRRVYAELLVQFPVYRTYVRHGVRDAIDQQAFSQALARAGAHIGRAETDLLAQLDTWLGGGNAPAGNASATGSVDLGTADCRRAEIQARAISRFQQLTPPLVAKSVEDTAFYRYGRLLSRNQVGSDPGQFALSVAQFNAACRARANCFPHAMLATATHDHKRGEDVTARLAVLSEVATEWRSCIARWRVMNARHRASRPLQSVQPLQALQAPLKQDRSGVDGLAPSAADEAMLYQTLVGVWPVDLVADDALGIASLAERVTMWQQKALREAKYNTDWVEPNLTYEQACTDFLASILADPGHNVFVSELTAWVRRIAPAGVVNSLTQTMLRLTVPGVPDLYQGTDLWDFTLVDPDNRRPVDYAARAAMLTHSPGAPVDSTPWQTGAIKQRIIGEVLAHRLRHPELYADGTFEPLAVEGAQAASVYAFLRRQDGVAIIVIVARLAAALTVGRTSPFIGSAPWADTRVILPEHAARTWSNHLTGETMRCQDASIAVDWALANLTVALLCQGVPADDT